MAAPQPPVGEETVVGEHTRRMAGSTNAGDGLLTQLVRVRVAARPPRSTPPLPTSAHDRDCHGGPARHSPLSTLRLHVPPACEAAVHEVNAFRSVTPSRCFSARDLIERSKPRSTDAGSVISFSPRDIHPNIPRPPQPARLCILIVRAGHEVGDAGGGRAVEQRYTAAVYTLRNIAAKKRSASDLVVLMTIMLQTHDSSSLCGLSVSASSVWETPPRTPGYACSVWAGPNHTDGTSKRACNRFTPRGVSQIPLRGEERRPRSCGPLLASRPSGLSRRADARWRARKG